MDWNKGEIQTDIKNKKKYFAFKKYGSLKELIGNIEFTAKA